MNNRRRSFRPALRGGGQFREGPFLITGEIPQGDFLPIFPRDLAPAFVKHCQFGNASVPSTASMFTFRVSRAWLFGLALWTVIFLSGCASPPLEPGVRREFS